MEIGLCTFVIIVFGHFMIIDFDNMGGYCGDGMGGYDDVEWRWVWWWRGEGTMVVGWGYGGGKDNGVRMG